MTKRRGLKEEAKKLDIVHLRVIEKEPFTPIGWLYTSVFQSMADRGLAVAVGGTYHISELGRELLSKSSPQRKKSS